MQFVGREQELNILKDAWKQTKRGKVQAVVIVGEPRFGKTRIIQEFYLWLNKEQDPENYWPDTLRSENDSLHVNPIYDRNNDSAEIISPPWLWWGLRWPKPDQRNTGQVSRCAALAGASNLDPHLEKFRQYLRHQEAKKKAVIDGSKMIGSIASGGVLGHLMSILDRIEDWRRIRNTNTEQLTIQQQLDRKIESQLTELQSLIIGLTGPTAFSEEGLPLILVLDDVHWADDESLQFLQRLIRHYCRDLLSGPRVLLIATTWEKEWNETIAVPLADSAYSQPKSFSEMLRSLEDEARNHQLFPPAVTECRLKKINEPLEILVTAQFPGLTTSQTKLIADRAGGSPGMLVELLIKIQENPHYFVKSDLCKELTKTGEGKIRSMIVEFRNLVEQRLSKISHDEINTLKIASYLGMNYSRPFVQQLAATILQTLEANLSETELQAILQRADNPLAIVQAISKHVDEFRLPIYQEVLRQQLEDHEDLWENMLQHIAAIIIQWLSEEKLSTFTADERTVFLNFANQEISARLTQENVPELQLALLRTASAQIYDLEASGRVLPMVPLLQQWMHVWQYCGVPSLTDLPLNQVNAVILCAGMLERHTEVQLITNACITIADSLPRNEQQSQLLLAGLRYLGDSLKANDQVKLAQVQYERYLREAGNAVIRYGTTAERLWDVAAALNRVGDILLRQDRVDEALKLHQESLALSERIRQDYGEAAGRLRDVAVALTGVGDILLRRDRVDEALKLHQESLALSERIRQDYGETAERLRGVSLALGRVGDILLRQDRVDEALKLYQESLALFERIRQDYGETAERLRGVAVFYHMLVGVASLNQNRDVVLSYVRKGIEVAQHLKEKYPWSDGEKLVAWFEQQMV